MIKNIWLNSSLLTLLVALFHSADAMAACSSVSTNVKSAFTEAQNFSNSCPAAKLAPGKYIAVNDYSGDGTPTMYIFDQSGNCEDSMPITWGAGTDKSGKLEACSTDKSKQTPPGFHITARHEDGARYNESNSIGLAGLCGQDSLEKRGILIHAAQAPGTGSSWGCTGVPQDKFAEVKTKLGVGSLVYNYFGPNPVKNCSDNAGFAPPQCKPEEAAVKASREAGNSTAGYSRGGGGTSSGSNRSGGK